MFLDYEPSDEINFPWDGSKKVDPVDACELMESEEFYERLIELNWDPICVWRYLNQRLRARTNLETLERFGMEPAGNVTKAIVGKRIGTLVS